MHNHINMGPLKRLIGSLIFFYIYRGGNEGVRRRKALKTSPKLPQSLPKTSQRLPQRLPKLPKASQSLPKGSPRVSQSLPKPPKINFDTPSLPESPRDPKERKRLLLRPNRIHKKMAN